MIFPNEANVVDLDRKHDDWNAYAGHWKRLRLLRDGGIRLKAAAAGFLISRLKEPPDSFTLRCQRLTYNNILGTAMGWYTSALFKSEPSVEWRTRSEDGRVSAPIREADRDLAAFLADCDRRRTPFLNFAQDIFESLALQGCACVLVDKPVYDDSVVNRAIERAGGYTRPLLVKFEPDQVFNWRKDKYGNLEWVTAYTCDSRSDDPLGDPQEIERWYVYDRTNFGIYERLGRKQNMVKLVNTGKHALSAQNRVPLHRICVPKRWWLGNRVYLQILEHLNQENTLGWQLHNGNLAMPVITSPSDVNLAMSEAGFLKLPPNSTFAWSEPAGTTLQASERRCASIREEVYRQLHLQAQGRSGADTAAVQSGYAKELEMAPAQDALEGFGDIMRPALEAILTDVAFVAQKQFVCTIAGFEFDTPAVTQKLEALNGAKESQIPSDTLIRELEKDCAAEMMLGKNQAVRDTIMSEIEAAPTMTERREQEAQAAEKALADQLASIAS